MRRVLLFFLFSLVFCHVLCEVFAQERRTLTGVVIGSDGAPLVGAAVVVAGASAGTVSDGSGRFVLRDVVGPDVRLRVSFVGYVPQEVKADGSKDLKIVLREDVTDLDQVVVTATRTPKALKDAPVVTRLITSDDIRKVDAGNVQDLLQQELPGLEFSFSMNQQTNLNLSGFGGNSVLFLVDGERMAGETLDNVDYSRLNLDNVGRIEIVKGAASTLYGSNAVGGVVNIISKESDAPWTLNVNSRYGSHNEWRDGVSASFSAGKVKDQLNVQRTSVDAIQLAKEGDSQSSLSKVYGSETWNVKDKISFTVSDRLKLSARAGFFFRERESAQTSRDRYRDWSAGLRGNWTMSDDASLELAYSFDQYDKSDYAVLSHKDVRDYSNVQHIVRGVFSRTWGKNTLTSGADFMRDFLMSYQFENGGDESQSTFDAFGQFDWNPTERFNVLAGVRYDHFSAADQNSLTGKLALMFKAAHCSLRLNYAGGFRAPTLKEMYMSFDMASIFMIYGNKDLKPERSHNFSVSVENAGKWADWARYNLTGTGHLNFVSSSISTVWSQERNGMVYANRADMKVVGADASFMVRTSVGVGLKVAYAFMHEVVPDGEPYTNSTRPHTLTARADYDRQWDKYGINVALSGRFLSKVTYDEYVSYSDNSATQEVSNPGYAIWRLIVGQRFWQGVSLTFTVDNLFNYKPKVYQNNSPATPGVSFAAGISVDVDKFLTFKK